MVERQITWQHALRFIEEARRVSWEPEKLPVKYFGHTTILLMSPRLKIREMRDWITLSVGHDYALSGIFKKNEENKNTAIPLPHMIRFTFSDMETAMLFKLTWI